MVVLSIYTYNHIFPIQYIYAYTPRVGFDGCARRDFVARKKIEKMQKKCVKSIDKYIAVVVL